MLHWYVVHSKPRKEAWLLNQFTVLQIEAYYPCYVEHGNSYQHKPKPYFPGYLFINVDLASTGTSVVQWIPGSQGLVSFGGEPAWVPDLLIQKIRCHLDEINKETGQILESLRPMDKVAIQSGPFAGYSGIFDSYLCDHERVRVFLQFMQDHQILVELPVEQITLKN